MKKRINLYTPNGEPKRIRCYIQKKNPSIDYITVVYTYAHYAGYPIGTVLYRAMNDHPYDPQGFGQWGECQPGRSFRASGSKVAFTELPIDCQKVVRQDYMDLWEGK